MSLHGPMTVILIMSFPAIAVAQECPGHTLAPASVDAPGHGIVIRNLDPKCPCCCRLVSTPRDGIWASAWAAKGDQEEATSWTLEEQPTGRWGNPIYGFPTICGLPKMPEMAEPMAIFIPGLDFIDAGFPVNLPLTGGEVQFDQLEVDLLTQAGLLADLGWFNLRVSYGSASTRVEGVVSHTTPTPGSNLVRIEGTTSILLIDLQRSIYEMRWGPVTVSAYVAAGIGSASFNPDSGSETELGGSSQTATLDPASQSWTGFHHAQGIDFKWRFSPAVNARVQVERSCVICPDAQFGGTAISLGVGISF